MHVTLLREVIFTAGVVFDNLSTSRLATARFLETGDTTGVRGRGDLALLEDLKAAGEFILSDTGTPISAAYLRRINATLTRSAALNPGRLRTDDQGIGVRTRYGRHEPPAVSETSGHPDHRGAQQRQRQRRSGRPVSRDRPRAAVRGRQQARSNLRRK